MAVGSSESLLTPPRSSQDKLPMADEFHWGLIPRLGVIAAAVMIVSIAAKPYAGKYLPYVNKLKDKNLTAVNLEPPKRRSEEAVSKSLQIPALTSPPPVARGALARKSEEGTKERPRDHLTDKDKSDLKAVLDKL